MAEQQRERIIQRASTMFVEEGVKAVRMDDIAQAMGISKRTLYEYFGDKEELLFLAMKHHYELLELKHKELAQAAPNVLIALLDIMNNIISESKKGWRMENSLRRFYPETHHRLIHEGEHERNIEFKRTLELGIKDGILMGGMDLDLSISLLRYMAKGVIHNSDEMNLPPHITVQDAFQGVFVSFMRGISTAKGMEIIDNYIESKKTKL